MRLTVMLALLFVALVVFSPAPVFGANAADKGGENAKEHKEGAHADEQLNPFKGGVDLALFSIIVFVILFGLLSTFAWPQIRAGLDKREKSIAHAKHEADRAHKEAAELRQKLEAEMAKAQEQVRQMIDKARQDAQATAAEELARGKAELAAERERMQRELKISTDDALHKIWDQAAQLATMISSKAVRKQLSMDDHRALVAEALNDFRASAQGRMQELSEARA